MKTIIAEICEESGLVDEIPFVICDTCGDFIDQMKCVTVMVSKGEPSHFYFCDDDCYKEGIIKTKRSAK